MTNLPYTDTDLRAEAAGSLDALVILPSPTDIGVSMRNAWVASTLNGDEGHTWGELLPDPADYATGQQKIHDLVNGAADTSEWAVNLGADGLQPDARTLDAGKSKIRIHFAFAPDISDTDRTDLIGQFATFMTNGLT